MTIFLTNRNEIIDYVFFCVCLLLINIMFLRFTYLVTCKNTNTWVSIFLWIDIWVVPNVWLLWFRLLWICSSIILDKQKGFQSWYKILHSISDIWGFQVCPTCDNIWYRHFVFTYSHYSVFSFHFTKTWEKFSCVLSMMNCLVHVFIMDLEI